MGRGVRESCPGQVVNSYDWIAGREDKGDEYEVDRAGC